MICRYMEMDTSGNKATGNERAQPEGLQRVDQTIGDGAPLLECLQTRQHLAIVRIQHW